MITPLDRFNEKWTPEPYSGCWLWTANTGTNGYGGFKMHGVGISAHRASWTLHRGEIPKGMCVCHKCDTPSCVNPDHLFVGTFHDNSKDRDAKNHAIGCRGEDHYASRLTASQVLSIRSDTRPVMEVACAYGISDNHVSSIRLRRKWRHLP